MPIAVPQFHSLAPPLALRYNSSAPNGWIGVGWGLSGTSTIQRGSDRGGTPGYTVFDKFYLDGQELMPSTALGGTHCTEVQSFTRIEYDGTNWFVTGKGGATSQYSPLFVTSEGVFRWYITEVVDVHGNRIDYNYEVEAAPNASVYLKTIEYNGTIITFRRETRSDPVHFGTGAEIGRTLKRLSVINVEVSGERARVYNLNYTMSQLTGRSMLRSVQQFGRDAIVNQFTGKPTGGSSLPPMQFDYAPGNDSMVNEGSWGTGGTVAANFWQKGRIRYGDFNGDGRSDVLYGPESNGDWEVALSNGTSFLPSGGGSMMQLWAANVYGNWEGDGTRASRVRVADVTGDGMSDVVIGPDGLGNWFVMVSTGTSFQNQGVWATNPAAGNYYSNNTNAATKMRIQDVNGDGKADIVLGLDGGGNVDVMLSTGSSFSAGTNWFHDLAFDNWWEAETASARVRLLDMTGDGLPDFLIGPDTAGNWSVLRNEQNGFAAAEQWMQNGPFGGVWADNTTASSRIRNADVNGDGLSDIILGPDSTGSWSTVVNTGTELVDDGQWAINTSYGHWSSNSDAKSRIKMFDVNGDRMADIVLGPDQGGNFHVLTSFGYGFQDQGSWISSAFNGIHMLGGIDDNDNVDTRMRSVDITGDGTLDFVYGPDWNGNFMVVRVGNRDNPGDAMEVIRNGIGGTSTVLYEPSSSWEFATLPIGLVMSTVASVTTDDGRNASSTTSYEYSGGLWSYEDRRFLGFRRVNAILNSTGDYVETYYFQQNGSLSKPEQVYLKDSSGIQYSTTVYSYTSNPSPPYTSLLTSVRRIERETSSSVSSTEKQFGYDQYGNVAWVRDLGNLAIAGDETFESSIYAPNTTDFIVSAPARLTSYKGIDSTGTLLSDVRYQYDGSTSYLTPPTKGNATEVRKWDSQTGGFIKRRQGYDSYGNLTQEVDEAGNLTSRVFDPVYHVYPISETNPLQHTVTREWDMVLGEQKVVTDVNQVTTTYQYDALGRPTFTLGADGYEKHVEYFDTGDPNLQRVKTTIKLSTSPPRSTWNVDYLDGLGRAWYSTRKGIGSNATNLFVRSQTDYVDTSRKAYRRSLPAHNGDPLIWTYYEYDRRNRVIKTIHPDGAFAHVSYDIQSNGRVVEDRYDENNDRSKVTRDVRGNVVKVVEFEGAANFTTYYAYDTKNRLEQITDHNGNVTQVYWDSLDRKTMTVDPTFGVVTMDHDDRGLEVESIDEKGNVTEAMYDALGRAVWRKVNGVIREVLRYDQPNQGASIGRLTNITYPGGAMSHDYDNYGRVVEDRITVSGLTRTFQKTYDLAGRIQTVTYPDGEVDAYGYDNSGNLKSTSAMVQEMKWTADNRLTFAGYNDASSESYTYDGARRWLNTAVIEDQNANIAFDSGYLYYPDGQVQSVTSSTHADETVQYAYDGLGRLKTVTGGQSESFTYDAIGNLRTSTNAGTLNYSGVNASPHAVTSVTDPSGTTTSYTYDANGNLTSRGGYSYGWNSDDRLASVTFTRPNGATMLTQFEYDSSGNRIREAILGRETLHFGGLFEVERVNGTVTKETKLYHAGQRLVGRGEVGAASRDTLHCDRLNSVRIVTDGTVKQDLGYESFGKVRRKTQGAKVEESYGGHRLDGQTGLTYMKARYYDASLGRFISPDTIVPSPFNPQSLNRYSYVLNNPIANTDPTGHAPIAVIASAVAVTGAGASSGIVALAWIGAATTTIGYINEDPELIAIGQVLTGFASGFAGKGLSAAWGDGFTGGVFGAAFAYSQSPISPLSPRAQLIVGWAFVEWGNFGDSTKIGVEKVAAAQNESIRRLAYKLGVQRLEEQTGLPAGSINMAITGMRHIRKVSLSMRQNQIEGMKYSEDRALARRGQSAGVTSIWGESLSDDAMHLAGSRTTGDENAWSFTQSPFGGAQSLGGKIFGFSYAPGSYMDGLLESFAGPHDWMNSEIYYNSMGRNTGGGWLWSSIGQIPNFVNIIVAIPFGGSTYLAPPESYWNTNY